MPEVGELVTSLDMAGCSLTVTWLDDNLERLWTAPAATPAFRRGALRASTKFTARRPPVSVQPEVTVEEASDTSLAAAIVARRAMEVLNRVVEKNKDMLGQLDSMRAAQQTQGGVQTVLGAAAAAFGDSAGGTSGILWGMLIDGVGKSLGNIEAVNAERVSAAVRRSATDLRTFSGAQLGDKTMLDALFPFVNILSAQVDAGTSLGLAWARAAEEAVAASEATASLVPKIGRARPLAERSVGTPDPGAISLGLIVSALGAVIAEADCTA